MRPLVLAACLALTAVSCTPRAEGGREMKYLTRTYSFTITPDMSPPRAREPVLYRIVILDRKTRQPIEAGEGQIYSNNAEGASTWDGFTYGPQVGTYYARLNFVVAGQWAVGLRFRRDSLHQLEKIEWMQDVLNPAPGTP